MIPAKIQPEIVALQREGASVAHALLELSKPRITRMVLITTWLGAVIAPGKPNLAVLTVALLGTCMVVAGANALNMYLETDVDGRMRRTRSRPLPSGRLAPEMALGFGLGLGVLGFALLTRWVNATSGLLAAAAFLSYAFVYTPLKKHSAFALHVGAVPGAIPPLIGWVAMAPELSLAALSLFGILFVWQLPHFMAIALFRAADYKEAGIKVYSAVYGEAKTQRAMGFWALVLLASSVLPFFLGVAGVYYLIVASALGLAFAALVFFGKRWLGDSRYARVVFFASIPHLVLLFAALGLFSV